MRDPQCMAEHQRPPLGECTCDAYTRGEEYGRHGGYEVGYKVGLDEGQRDERGKWEANGPYFTSVVHECCERVQNERAAALSDAIDAVKAVEGLDLTVWMRDRYVAAIEELRNK